MLAGIISRRVVWFSTLQLASRPQRCAQTGSHGLTRRSWCAWLSSAPQPAA
jgi:hypothetical protein